MAEPRLTGADQIAADAPICVAVVACAEACLAGPSNKVATPIKPTRVAIRTTTSRARLCIFFEGRISFLLSRKAQSSWANELIEGLQLEIETISVWAVRSESVLAGAKQSPTFRRQTLLQRTHSLDEDQLALGRIRRYGLAYVSVIER